jgi:alpha-ribazole phosphatase
MQITFIRHTSVAVESGICYGQSDVSLSDSFQKEADLINEKLQDNQFDAVFTSPLTRCQLLAEYCGYKPISDSRLSEMNFGNWELQAWEAISDPQLDSWFKDWVNEKPTNGESFSDLYARVSHFLNAQLSTGNKRIAIFTHAGVIRAAAAYFNKMELSDTFDIRVGFGEIMIFEQ